VQAVTLAERGQPNGVSGRSAIPVAGDDQKAKATTIKLIEATGFDALDSGSLSDSWRQQPGTPGHDNSRDDTKSERDGKNLRPEDGN
jgi:8-hydroxy-5-deazaflavin:NADPH oxidoreductase